MHQSQTIYNKLKEKFNTLRKIVLINNTFLLHDTMIYNITLNPKQFIITSLASSNAMDNNAAKETIGDASIIPTKFKLVLAYLNYM